jgi:hypothetical protein
MVFDVKYDLRHNARLAGGNWTVNDKEDIYSGVVRMDTVTIGFFLGDLVRHNGMHKHSIQLYNVLLTLIWSFRA